MKDLTQALKSGDSEAFRRLYEQEGQAMLRIARRILGPGPDAEDAVQEAFLSIYRRIADFRGESKLATWLYRVTVNASLKILESHKDRTEESDLSIHEAARTAPAASGENPGAYEARDALERELSALPLRQRTVFSLSAVEGLSSAEIGKVLGLSAGAVRFHLCQARERLRKRLGPYLCDASVRGKGEQP